MVTSNFHRNRRGAAFNLLAPSGLHTTKQTTPKAEGQQNQGAVAFIDDDNKTDRSHIGKGRHKRCEKRLGSGDETHQWDGAPCSEDNKAHARIWTCHFNDIYPSLVSAEEGTNFL